MPTVRARRAMTVLLALFRGGRALKVAPHAPRRGPLALRAAGQGFGAVRDTAAPLDAATVDWKGATTASDSRL